MYPPPETKSKPESAIAAPRLKAKSINFSSIFDEDEQ
jgi:hypothetical protein